MFSLSLSTAFLESAGRRAQLLVPGRYKYVTCVDTKANIGNCVYVNVSYKREERTHIETKYNINLQREFTFREYFQVDVSCKL